MTMQPSSHHPVHSPGSDPTRGTSIIDTVRRIVEEHGTRAETLQSLEAQNKHAELKRLLKNLALEALRGTLEFERNRGIIHDKRLSEQEQRAATERQRYLLTEMMTVIALEANLSTTEWLEEMNIAQMKIRDILETSLANGEINTKSDILRALGILINNGEAEVFAYPVGLFPESVDYLWEAYLESVANHLTSVEEFQAGTSTKEEYLSADSSRKIAHDAISRAIVRILGGEWTFEEVRRLVEKMRDNRFPTIESGETHKTADLITEHLGSDALKAALALLSNRNK